MNIKKVKTSINVKLKKKEQNKGLVNKETLVWDLSMPVFS